VAVAVAAARTLTVKQDAKTLTLLEKQSAVKPLPFTILMAASH